MKATLIVGPQCSGKTTLALQLINESPNSMIQLKEGVNSIEEMKGCISSCVGDEIILTSCSLTREVVSKIEGLILIELPEKNVLHLFRRKVAPND